MNTDFSEAKENFVEHKNLKEQKVNENQNNATVDEITIVIRGGKVVKFEQRLVPV